MKSEPMNKDIEILVVEDDPDLGQLIKLMLQYRKFSVTMARSGEEAERILSAGGIDLVIMDMLLSGSYGTDICKNLRQNTSTSHISVIMTSAYPNGRELCMDAGATDFIPKPFDMEDLLSKVDDLISKKEVQLH